VLVIGGLMMTRSIWTLAFLFLALTLQPLAHEGFDPHIRSSEPELLDAVARGVDVSPTLRALVDRLETSDVVVYLAFDRSPSPQLAGHLSLITAAGGRRYLRVAIDRRNAGCQRIAILGHELQHAVEIAESPSVTDEAALAALYRRIGFRSEGGHIDCFDSVGAILAGRTVEKEVRDRYTEFTRGSR
jgi:hypothetical protein